MILPKLKKTYTGLYINQESISAALVAKRKKEFRVMQLCRASMPAETLRLSYRTKSIVNSDMFRKTVMAVTADLNKKKIDAGVSLPDELTKIFIQRYAEIPKTESATNKMIAWRMEKKLHTSLENAIISHSLIGQDANRDKILLVVIGMKDVIRDFELNLLEAGVHAKCVLPAGLNQLNFFISRLPSKGTIAFIGLFEYFFTFFVFEDSLLTFYHGTKKGLSDLNFFQDIDMIMRHYLNANPGKELEQLFVGSQVAFHRELSDVFNNLSNIDVHVMQEDTIIKIDDRSDKIDLEHDLSYYVPAIGAACSILKV